VRPVAGLSQGGHVVDIHAQADHPKRISFPGRQVEAEVTRSFARPWAKVTG
jgi:hypothetical protein